MDTPAASRPQLLHPQKLQKKPRKAFYVYSRAEHFGEKFWPETKNFLTFGQGAIICRLLGETILAELSTQHFIGPERGFETNGFFFPQKSKFDILFWFWRKKFRICGRRFRQGCSKQNPRDQRNFLVKLYLEEDTTFDLLMVFLRKLWFARKLQVRQ